MYPNSMLDIMIQAQAIVDKTALPHKMPKLEKGHNSVKYL